MTFSCPICSENLNRAPADPTNRDGSKISCAPCGHIFHVFCISKWLEGTMATSSQCPCCRKPIKGRKCLPLFPTLQDDSLAEDPDDVNCSHGPQLEENRIKIATLERQIREKDILHQKLMEDFNTRSTELRQERQRCEDFLLKYKQAESFKTYAKELEQKNKSLQSEVETLRRYSNLIESIREGREANEYDYPPTKDSINTLKNMNSVLNRELIASNNKKEELQNRVRTEVHKREDLRRELERLRVELERKNDTMATLKIELEELRRDNLDDAIAETPEGTPKRKRVNTEESVVIVSPDVDQDVMLLKPLHKRKELKPKGAPQGSSAFHNSRKDLPGSSTSSSQSSVNSDDSDFLYPGFKKVSKKKLVDVFSTPAGASSAVQSELKKKKEPPSSDPLTPQGFTENLKCSLPGLSRTPSGTFLGAKPVDKNLVPKPPKVLKKK